MDIDLFIWILAGVVLLNACYYFYYIKFAFSKTDQRSVAIDADDKITDPVSVIVCAKNEADNLKNLLPQLLDQDYPDFEVIVVNDYSRDETLEVIEEFQEQDARVKIVDVVPNESFWGNKKYALTLGIKKALHDKLLFIDADCIPASKAWIKTMSSIYGKENTIAIGYGGYYKKKNSFLNALIRFETGFSAMQYLSFALHGNAYMGVGRNLGYTATQFYESRGFMSHMHILGGDDDLFVNGAATRKNTAVSIVPDSFTFSKPKTHIKAWWKQKRRHVNTSSHYKWKHKISLGLFHFSQIAFFIASILAVALSPLWIYIIGIIALRYLVVWIIAGKSLYRLNEKGLIAFYPVMEFLLLLSHLALFLSNLSSKPKYWE